MKLRNQCLALLVLCISAVSGQAADNELRVVAGHSDIVFNTLTGLPKRWELCQDLCEADDPRRALLMDQDDGFYRLTSVWGTTGLFESSVDETETHVIVRFASPGSFFEYSISRTEPLLEVTVPDEALISIGSATAFVPEALPGFGAIYSRVNFVQVDESGQTIYPFDADVTDLISLAANDQNWTGLRNRYWAFLMQPVNTPAEFGGNYSAENRPYLSLKGDSDSNHLTLRMYAGPVGWQKLRSVDPVLSEMLFAALWDFLRWLCFGMLMLLEFLYGLVGHYGLAIILLSLSAKVLMSPLTMLADKWQSDVNRIQSLLKPELDEIKGNFSGEVAHQMTLDVYKKNDVSMFYTFKSAAGFLIQIPVFIAAFDVLAENNSLNQISFLWIADLAKPDSLAALPFVLPFFGGWLNVLPFLMTFLSVLAAWLQSEDTLTPELQRQQSLRLYLMAAAFFVLFYTFPAGMVLYWTSSNLFHLIKVESGRLLNRG